MATLQTVTRKTLHFAQTLSTACIIAFLFACFLAGFILFIPILMVTGLLLAIAGHLYSIATMYMQQWLQQLARERSALRRIAGMHRRALQRYRLSFGKTQLS
jgi:hypothetical protein